MVVCPRIDLFEIYINNVTNLEKSHYLTKVPPDKIKLVIEIKKTTSSWTYNRSMSSKHTLRCKHSIAMQSLSSKKSQCFFSIGVGQLFFACADIFLLLRPKPRFERSKRFESET